MSVQQRLNLEAMLRQQRSPDDETLMVNWELLKKLRIPAEDKALYMRDIQTPQGQATEFFMKNIQAAPEMDVELESAELRRLDTVLKEWKQYTTDDVEWLQGVKSQIASVQNGIAPTTKQKKLREAAN